MNVRKAGESMKEYSEEIIDAFMFNAKLVDISRQSGLSLSQVKRLRKNADFQKIIRQRKDEIVRTSVNRMQAYFIMDVDVLQNIIKNKDINPQTRIYAISVLFSSLKDWMTISDLVERMDDIEKEQERQRGDFFEINS